MNEGAPGPANRNVRYFESVADRYSAFYDERTAGGTGFRLRRQHVLGLFDKPSGVVLDVGCGPGVLVQDLVARGCTYYGIDPAQGMIAQCVQHFGALPRVHFSVENGEQTGFPDNTFDAVLCVGVLDRLAHDDALLRELVRVLKREGTLIVTASSIMSPYMWWRDLVYEPITRTVGGLYYRLFSKPRRGGGVKHRLYSAGGLAGRLLAMGCPVDQVSYTGFLLLPRPFDTLLPGLASRSMEWLEQSHRGFFRYLGSCMVLKARKT